MTDVVQTHLTDACLDEDPLVHPPDMVLFDWFAIPMKYGFHRLAQARFEGFLLSGRQQLIETSSQLIRHVHPPSFAGFGLVEAAAFIGSLYADEFLVPVDVTPF
ncbi:MAG: hypothetical protein ABIL58_27145 [Pseudomonadota bacterium]